MGCPALHAPAPTTLARALPVSKTVRSISLEARVLRATVPAASTPVLLTAQQGRALLSSITLTLASLPTLATPPPTRLPSATTTNMVDGQLASATHNQPIM